jgi:hypothetical protein
MAIFTVTNANDEVSQYQMGRYVSSNEAIWRIFSFCDPRKTPYSSPFGSSSRKWTTSVFQSRKRGGQSDTATVDNIIKFLLSLSNRCFRSHFDVC